MKISSAERLWRCKLKVSSSVFCSLKNTLKSAQINLFRKTFYVKYPGHFIIVHFNLRNIFHANQGYFKCLWAVFGCAFFISTDEDLAIQIKGMILKKKYKIDGNEYENHKKNVKKNNLYKSALIESYECRTVIHSLLVQFSCRFVRSSVHICCDFWPWPFSIYVSLTICIKAAPHSPLHPDYMIMCYN